MFVTKMPTKRSVQFTLLLYFIVESSLSVYTSIPACLVNHNLLKVYSSLEARVFVELVCTTMLSHDSSWWDDA